MKEYMNEYELKEIIERHQHYLNHDVDGWEDMRADLRGVNLQEADLRWAYLNSANLIGANLQYANLQDAYLYDADLEGANLYGANLCDAHMKEANLKGANLEGADLSETNLMYVNLEGANLKGANLSGTDIRYANLSRANLQKAILCYTDLSNAILCETDLKWANLSYADLTDTNLEQADLVDTIIKETDFEGADLRRTYLSREEEFRRGIILSENIIGWKKCEDNIIVELEIPKGAVVFSINGCKCRTNRCKVLSISDGDTAYSTYDPSFTYKVGKEIEVEHFNLIYNVECGSGIHFFKNKEDAEFY